MPRCFLIFLTVLSLANASALAQIVAPNDEATVVSPVSPVFDEDPESAPLSSQLIESCIVDSDAIDLIEAYRVQVSQHDASDCKQNAYFTNSQIRVYLLQIINKTPIENVANCRNLNSSLINLFARTERRAISGGVCDQPIERCEVVTSGSNLNFRHFPHVDGFPDPSENKVSRKDQIIPGSTVTVGARFRGWAYVSASGISNVEFIAGWVSSAHLDKCQIR